MDPSSYQASRPKSNFRLETVRKGVRATLRALIWSVYRGQNRPNSASSVPCEATFHVPSGLFGQFLYGVLGSSAIHAVLIP